jgi:alpha-beta hydrolase superfamily lysophospholipase
MIWTVGAALIASLLLPATALAQGEISFPTADAGLIYADLYGSGVRAVVLAHGGRLDRKSWSKQADALANVGFIALAIDFRGEGKSRGALGHPSREEDRRFDVLGAIQYLRHAGASSVSVVGASMGGDYAAEAAEAEPEAIDRLVLLASGAYTPLVHFKGRKLFILARDDANAEGPRLPKIRVQYEKASEPKQLVVVDGSAHAQFLFATPQGDSVWQRIVNFLTAP